MLTVVAIIALMIGVFCYCLMTVPAYTGVVIINKLTGSLRSCGAGLRLLFPWETIADSGISLKKNSHAFDADFETKDESTISLRISFDEMANEHHLVEFQAFALKDRINGITERIKSILSIEIRKLKNRDAVIDTLKNLAEEAKKNFEEMLSEKSRPLEEYYGTNLKVLTIADVALPQALKDAQVEKEAIVKRNETRQLEMTKMKQMARALVKESGDSMPLQTALEVIQVQFEKIEKKIQIFGVEKGTQQALTDILKEVINARKS